MESYWFSRRWSSRWAWPS